MILGIILSISVVGAIWGIPMFIIGLVILLNKKEDEIEQRKDTKGGKKK